MGHLELLTVRVILEKGLPFQERIVLSQGLWDLVRIGMSSIVAWFYLCLFGWFLCYPESHGEMRCVSDDRVPYTNWRGVYLPCCRICGGWPPCRLFLFVLEFRLMYQRIVLLIAMPSCYHWSCLCIVIFGLGAVGSWLVCNF